MTCKVDCWRKTGKATSLGRVALVGAHRIERARGIG
jgi:hypothetical protein